MANKKKVNKTIKKSIHQILLCKEQITIKQIYERFSDTNHIEIWQDAGVMEIELGEKSYLDIEELEPDESDKLYQSVYALTFPSDAKEEAESYIRQIQAGLSCDICDDDE